MKSHFCVECGTILLTKLINGRQREYCPQCGWIYYLQRKLSAGVRVSKQDTLLLVQRAIEPWYGKWCLPAGFVEVDEDPEQAAIREAYEETGLSVKIKKLAGIYPYNNDPRGNGLVVIYEADIIGGNIQVNEEALQVGFYTSVEIQKMEFAGANTDRQVQDWLDLMKSGKESG